MNILREIHECHMGISKMKASKGLFFWPGLSKDIDEFVRTCHTCIRFSNKSENAPMSTTVDQVDEPWQRIAIDITGPSKRLSDFSFLSVIDYYSRFPFVFRLNNTTSSEVIKHLANLFSVFGYPLEVVSDNGPNLVSEQIENFFKQHGIKHNKSAIYYPQSNGVVERFHATLKDKLDKVTFEKVPFHDALRVVMRDIRSFPSEGTGRSPAFLFFGREMRGKFHNLGLNNVLTTIKRDYMSSYDKINLRSRRKFSHLVEGQKVLWQMRRNKINSSIGTIVGKVGRSTYKVKFENGCTKIINQRFLKILPEVNSSQFSRNENIELSGALIEKSEEVSNLPTNPSHTYNLRPRRVVNYKV